MSICYINRNYFAGPGKSVTIGELKNIIRSPKQKRNTPTDERIPFISVSVSFLSRIKKAFLLNTAVGSVLEYNY